MRSPSADQLQASAAPAVDMNEPKSVHEAVVYANENQPLKRPMTGDDDEPKLTLVQHDHMGTI